MSMDKYDNFLNYLQVEYPDSLDWEEVFLKFEIRYKEVGLWNILSKHLFNKEFMLLPQNKKGEVRALYSELKEELVDVIILEEEL